MSTTAAGPGTAQGTADGADDGLARLLLLAAACRAAEETMLAIEQLPLQQFLV